jgi:probable phosphoglycerate mutase
MIYLVRHGEYDNPRNINPGRLPVPLSSDGISQARKLCNYFKDKNIAIIYSSPVLRCKQTAEIIADNRIPIFYDTRLAETLSAYQGMWYDGKIDSEDLFGHRKELGGESYEDIKSRMLSFFNQVVKREGGNSIICSHSDPLWCLYLGILNRPLTDEVTEPGENGNPEYLQKGAIRPLKVENRNYVPLGMILQESL